MDNNKKNDLKFKSIVFSTQKQDVDKFRLPKKIFSLIIYFIILIAVIYFVFISDYFRIKNVKVENVKSVEIVDYLNQTLLGKNILFMLPGRYLEVLINKFPVLEEARIVRGLPDTIRIVVDERDQKFIWCNSEKCYEVDNNGYVFEETVKSDDVIVLKDMSNIKVNKLEQIVSKQFIGFFIQAIDGLKELGIVITEAQIKETTFKIEFITNENWKIIMDSSGSCDNQLYAVKQVIESNRSDIKEYIDVRVEGSVFIK